MAITCLLEKLLRRNFSVVSELCAQIGGKQDFVIGCILCSISCAYSIVGVLI